MPLISKDYREQNRLLHEQRPDYGTSGSQWAPYIDHLVSSERYDTVLDYGCGKGLLAQELAKRGKAIAEYDPAIPGKDATPEPAELVCCTDVLEHIEPVHINAVMRDLKRVTKRKLFFNISTRPATKNLPDGRNAHLIVQGPDWWRARLSDWFHITAWNDTEYRDMVYGEAVPRGVHKVITPTKRRRITPQLAAQIDVWKQEINHYADAFSKVDTMRMWESIEDESADIQVAINIVEYLPDPEAALRNIAQLSRKGTIITVKLDEKRNEAWWKALLEKRFRFAQWQVEHGHAMMIGAPMVSVQGVTAIGAVASEERWEQVKAATLRFKQRIEPHAPHGRRAIIACYGPSLADTMDLLKAHAAEPDTDVFSVSGSHDFLIEHGIVPDAHIECDPRLHKADNLDKPHPDVTYMIASTCHPGYFDKLEAGGANIQLWHVSTPEHGIRLVSELGEPSKYAISGGGSVGLRAIPLLYALGYRDMSFFAMDCSFKLPADVLEKLQSLAATEDPAVMTEAKQEVLDTIQQWAGKHAGKKQALVEVMCEDRLFISSPVLLTYATNFFETVQKVTDLNIRLYGDGLLQAMARYFMGESETFMPQLAREDADTQAAA